MSAQRNLRVEGLERRDVFSGMPGTEGFHIYDAPLQDAGDPPTTFSCEGYAEGNDCVVDGQRATNVIEYQNGDDPLTRVHTADGVERLAGDRSDAHITQATDEEIIEALNNGTQLKAGNKGLFDGSDVGFSVVSPRDAASGLATGKFIDTFPTSLAYAEAVDRIFLETDFS